MSTAEASAARTRPVAVRGHTLRLLGSELGLTFRRPRNLAVLGALALVPVILGVVLKALSGEMPEASIIGAAAGNGVMLTFSALFVLVQFMLPVVVAIVAGDAIAGEASLGTLRYLLIAPAGRTRLLLVKYASAVLFCLAATGVVTLSALIIGFALFPIGPVTLLSGTTVPLADGLLRALMATGYVTAGMAALAAVALAFSTLTEAPIGAITATVVTVIVMWVLMAIPQLAPVTPYLLSYWWAGFDASLRDPLAVGDMLKGLFAFAAYTVVFGSVAYARFSGRDVTA